MPPLPGRRQSPQYKKWRCHYDSEIPEQYIKQTNKLKSKPPTTPPLNVGPAYNTDATLVSHRDSMLPRHGPHIAKPEGAVGSIGCVVSASETKPIRARNQG